MPDTMAPSATISRCCLLCPDFRLIHFYAIIECRLRHYFFAETDARPTMMSRAQQAERGKGEEDGREGTRCAKEVREKDRCAGVRVKARRKRVQRYVRWRRCCALQKISAPIPITSCWCCFSMLVALLCRADYYRRTPPEARSHAA